MNNKGIIPLSVRFISHQMGTRDSEGFPYYTQEDKVRKPCPPVMKRKVGKNGSGGEGTTRPRHTYISRFKGVGLYR